jgi:uncharacterized membrane protein YbhN (UPF0104 family)
MPAIPPISDTRQSPSSLRLRKGLVGLALVVTLYAVAAFVLGPADPVAAVRSLLTPTGIAAAGLCFLNYLLRGWRWRSWMARAGRPMAPTAGLRIYLAGYIFTPTPANVGESARGMLLADKPMGAAQSMAIFGAERLADLLCLGLLCLPAAWWLVAQAPLLLVALAAAGLAGAVALYLARGAAVRRLPWLLDAWACLAVRPARWFALTLWAWIAQGLAVWLLCQQSGLDVDAVQATASYAVAMVGGALSTLPAGLGGTEAILAALLVRHGAALAQAATITLQVRLVTLWFAVALGALALAYSLFIRKDLRI